MLKHWLIIVWMGWGLLCVLPLFAQNKRIEISARADRDYFKVIPLREQGVVISQESDRKILLSRYDLNLQKLGQYEIPFENKYAVSKYYAHQGFLYILYNIKNLREFHILSFDLKEGTYQTLPISAPGNLEIADILVLDNSAYITVAITHCPVLLHVDLKSGQISSFSFESRGETIFGYLQADTLQQLVYLPVINKNHSNYTTVIHSFYRGKSVAKLTWPESTNKNILNAQVILQAARPLYVVGNYNLYQRREISQGFFTGEVNSKGLVESVEFFDYSQERHYFEYLEENKSNKLQVRVNRLEIKNKNYSPHYRTHPQPIQMINGQILWVDNAYDINLDPHRYSSSRTWIPLPKGWYFKHSTISAFNREGRHLWSHTIPINQLKPHKDREIIQINQKGDSLISTFPEGNRIRLNYHIGHKLLPGIEEKIIGGKTPDEKIIYRSSYQTNAWHANKLLVWGFQKIRSPQGNREVFFLEAIAL